VIGQKTFTSQDPGASDRLLGGVSGVAYANWVATIKLLPDVKFVDIMEPFMVMRLVHSDEEITLKVDESNNTKIKIIPSAIGKNLSEEK
jgi:hypothetical protein